MINSHFAIINHNNISAKTDLKLIKRSDTFSFYVTSSENVLFSNERIFYVNGYLVPRNKLFNLLSKYQNLNLIDILYSEHNNSFTNFIKGNFIIIIVENDKIKIFTDHFGLRRCFYSSGNQINAVSDSVNILASFGIDLIPDKTSLAINSALNQNLPGFTIYENIFRTTPSAFLELSSGKPVITTHWNFFSLWENINHSCSDYDLPFFAGLLKENFKNFNSYLKPEGHAITLTGGKDSRTGLAALMSLNIIPHGFTYGNPDSRDSIYAKILAEKISLKHHIFNPPVTEEWFDLIVNEIINYGNPEISMHRAHRLYAFKNMAISSGGEYAYYAGYMGGEFLMGVYYDDLIFTKYLTDFWETSVLNSLEKVFKEHFLKPNSVDINEVINRLSTLNSLDQNLSKNERQFHGIFEIGIPHHAQDTFLSGCNFDYVYPFLIDIDFLEALFSSKYSFLFNDNKTINPIKRHKLFEFNLNIQHILYPGMDEIPFGKRGSYNTKEYLRGGLYWSIIKTLRILYQRRTFPANFAYGISFKSFLLRKLNDLYTDKNHLLNEYFDIKQAISELNSIDGPRVEKELHKFSNIVMLYIQLQKNEKIKANILDTSTVI